MFATHVPSWFHRSVAIAPRRARCSGALAVTVAALLVGAQVPLAHAADPPVAAFSKAAVGGPPAGWKFASLPRKTPTKFSVVELDGSHVLKVQADDSYGNLVHAMKQTIGPSATVAWRWRVDTLVDGADLREKSGDDSPAKLCVFFDFDSDKLSFGERAKLSIASSSSGEDLPTQTLCYVWDNKLPVGTEMVNAFTQRLRFIVLESGSGKLGQWVNERRNLAADYLRAFADEAGGKVPAVSGIAVAADADNTHGHALSYFGDVTLTP